MWATIVDRDGVVCAVAFSGKDRFSQWPGSRVISAQKANTANAFGLDSSSNSDGSGQAKGLALSTANLFSAVQPGGSLYGLQFSNPVNDDVALQDSVGSLRHCDGSHERRQDWRRERLRRRPRSVRAPARRWSAASASAAILPAPIISSPGVSATTWTWITWRASAEFPATPSVPTTSCSISRQRPKQGRIRPSHVHQHRERKDAACCSAVDANRRLAYNGLRLKGARIWTT